MGNGLKMVTGDAAQCVGLADALRQRSRGLHTRAERTGVIGDMLRGRATRDDYVRFVRNLVPVYRQLEAALERHRDHPALAPLMRPELYRTASLTSDIATLYGPGWARDLPVVPAATDYALRIETIADGDPTLLVAHAYVRYLGDINGGQIIARLLAQSLDLSPAELSFYAFPDIADLPAFRTDYRRAFAIAGDAIGDHSDLLDEVVAAFEMNIMVSESVRSTAVAA